MLNRPGDRDDVTRLLEDFVRGVSGAAARLMPIVYDELKKLASKHLQHERPNHTLQPTALVHEVYQRLIRQNRSLDGRRDFFCFASRVMRNVLVDYERKRRAEKRGGNAEREDFRTTLHAGAFDSKLKLDVLALDEALTQLSEISRIHVQIIELRFFAGLTAKETAHQLGLAEITVKKYWSFARAWLLERMTEEDQEHE